MSAGAKAVDGDNELMTVEEIAVSDGGDARFAPVEITSGEEKYDVLWEEAGKLLRFDEGENAWKERGQGVARILRQKSDPTRLMFIFRRDGIGKLAAQHYLLKGMKVSYHAQNEKNLLWVALKDFTDDDEGYPENFVLRLASKELAEKAKKAMEDAIGLSGR